MKYWLAAHDYSRKFTNVTDEVGPVFICTPLSMRHYSTDTY